MWKYFQRQKDLVRKVETLQQIIRDKNTKISELISEIGPEQVIENILKRDISFYPYEKLDYESQLSYYADAQSILNNEVFKNETNHLIADWIEHLAYRSKSFEDVKDIRMTINGLEFFKERLKKITNPEKEQSFEELDSAI
jgi:hypothetical protein